MLGVYSQYIYIYSLIVIVNNKNINHYNMIGAICVGRGV